MTILLKELGNPKIDSNRKLNSIVQELLREARNCIREIFKTLVKSLLTSCWLSRASLRSIATLLTLKWKCLTEIRFHTVFCFVCLGECRLISRQPPERHELRCVRHNHELKACLLIISRIRFSTPCVFTILDIHLNCFYNRETPKRSFREHRYISTN